MKENRALVMDLVIGILLIGVGMAMQDEYYSLMAFSGGVGLAFGSMMHLFRSFYWNRPANRTEYERKKQEAYINRVDERKQLLRMKAGHVSAQIMLIVLLLLDLVLALLRVEVWVIGMVAALFLALYVMYYASYYILEKRM